MMSTTFESRRLPATFTFRIVEAVKRTKIQPMPRMTGIPWGLSLAAGIAVVIMTFGSQMAIYQQQTPLTFPGETETLKVREIAIDILSAPGTSVMAGKQGDTDGVGMDQRSPQSNFFLAPAKGGGTWTRKADMPTARSIAGSAVVDGKIYVVGGAPVPYGVSTVVEEYDPATDTWTTRADMPTTRQGIVAAAVDGIIYAIGGWNGKDDVLTTVEAYDPATDMWTRKADMPTARNTPAIAVVDGGIYVIGGYSFHPHRTVLSAVEAYDPATDIWTKKADMPTARFHHAACVLDGQIYVSGGSPNFFGSTDLPTVEVYDPATDTWTQASDMPVARYRHAASAVDGKMYIIGGQEEELIKLWREGKLELEEDEMAELFTIVYVYDPATDTWTTAADPLPTARSGLTAAIVDGKIYAIGGGRGDPYELLSIVEEYAPGLPDRISVTSPAGKLLRTWGEVKSE